jgi:hypothetical protein
VQPGAGGRRSRIVAGCIRATKAEHVHFTHELRQDCRYVAQGQHQLKPPPVETQTMEIRRHWGPDVGQTAGKVSRLQAPHLIGRDRPSLDRNEMHPSAFDAFAAPSIPRGKKTPHRSRPGIEHHHAVTLTPPPLQEICHWQVERCMSKRCTLANQEEAKGSREAESISLMPAHHAKRPLLVVTNARHSPGYGCALRLDQAPFDVLLGHARKTLSLRVQKSQRAPKCPLCADARNKPQTRLRYSCVRVSISILSPVSTNSGTETSKPVASLAGLRTLPEVSPLTAGSV